MGSLHAQTRFNQISNQYRLGEISAKEAIALQLEILSHDHDHPEGEIVKCIHPLLSLVEKERQNLDSQTLLSVANLFPTSSNSSIDYISPSGNFRINYQTTGADRVPLDDNNSNGVPDYVEWAAEAADSSYREHIRLGFPDIFTQKSRPFEIRLEQLGFYGYVPGSDAGYIGVENDFAGFPPNTDPEGNQRGALKVTIAHELKHVIQYVQNNFNGETDNWAEMDATLMEEVVYDNVNDYYNYISGFSSDLFSSPQVSLRTNITAGSYEDITWALYFHERFGEFFWSGVWDRIEADANITMVEAVEDELSSLNEDADLAFLESYMWHFASGSNFSASNYGFGERLEYPNPDIFQTFNELQFDITNPRSLNMFSARYYSAELLNPENRFVQLNYESGSNDIHFGLIGYQNDGTVEVNEVLGSRDDLVGTIQAPWSWQDVSKVGLVVMNSNPTQASNYAFQFTQNETVTEFEISQNFPNPFNPSTNIRIAIPERQEIKLEVFDVLGRHIQTLFEGTLNPGIRNFVFDASSLSSGVYIYRIESPNGVETKRMTFIK